MRVPQVSERIKEAPAQALRGVFAGIGQLLLITDKFRNKTPVGQDVARARRPERARTPGTAGTATDVIVARPEQREEAPASGGPISAGAEQAVAGPVSAPAEGAPAEGAPAEGPPAEGAPPLANYGELSVASLRARLRNLDVAQVRRLADYERGHAARADVLTMFERRIAKLEAES